CVAGEAEELSPLEYSERLMAALKGPKQMVVYQESRHSVGNVPAANLGPFPPILLADWLADRLAGKPFVSEHWYVAGSGEITKTPYLIPSGNEGRGANPMNAIFGIVLQAAGAFILAASAQSPAAVVEEIQGGVPGIAFMDYVEPGQIILSAHDRIVLGYLKSCWRETISGGTVTVGPEQSE